MVSEFVKYFQHPHMPGILKKLGQRGQVLMLLGVIYVSIGVTLIITRDDLVNQIVYKKVISYAPFGGLAFWGVVWVVVGLTAAFYATRPTGKDVWGFAAITFWTICWACQSFFTVALFGFLRIVIGLCVYAALAGISMIVSGMRGPDDD